MYYTEADDADMCPTSTDVDRNDYSNHKFDDVTPVVDEWRLVIYHASRMVDYER